MKHLVERVQKENYSAAGYVLDNDRIKALHISGILVETKIAKTVSMFPMYENGDQILDVLDIVLMINMILSNEYNVLADVNEDGSLNILDVIVMINILVGGLP